MQGPAQSVSGTLQSPSGPQPVNLMASILVVMAQQQVLLSELTRMLRPLAEFYELELKARIDALDNKEPQT